MMKKILVACDHSRMDGTLRRSLAHLTQSCRISLTRDAFCTFDEIRAQAFDLIIIDDGLPGIDSLEVIETVQHVDPVVPVILILDQTYQGIWNTIRHLQIHPITRPFKPRRFLRLVDRVLHQHLNQYRQLAETLHTILSGLCTETASPCALFTDDTGQVMLSTGEMDGITPESLGKLAIDGSFSNDTTPELLQQDDMPHRSSGLFARTYGLYTTFVADNLNLVLVSTIVSWGQGLPETWQQVDEAVGHARVAIFQQFKSDISRYSPRNRLSRNLIPFELNRDDALSLEGINNNDLKPNWDIIKDPVNLATRLDEFCRIS